VPTPSALPLRGCPGLCRSHIRFAPGAGALDVVEVHGVVEADALAAADLATLPVGVSLASELRGIFLREHLGAGQLVRDGRTALYRDPAAKRTGGIASLRVTRLEGTETRLRVDVRVFADVESLATDPTMELRIELGEASFASVAQWSRTLRGWYVDLPD